MIINILAEKQAKLKHYGRPDATNFTLEEIEELSDEAALRAFKLRHPFPTNYAISSDLIGCTRDVCVSDDLYKVLEFCMLKNRILRGPVTSVFPQLRR